MGNSILYTMRNGLRSAQSQAGKESNRKPDEEVFVSPAARSEVASRRSRLVVILQSFACNSSEGLLPSVNFSGLIDGAERN
jgi:hypothetical protein